MGFQKGYRPEKLNRKFHHYFLFVGFVTTVALLAVLTILFMLEKESRLEQSASEERASLEHQKKLILKSFENIVSDLKILASLNELESFLNSSENHARYLTEREYLVFMHHKSLYDQIRYLNDGGMEKIRVNFNSGNPMIVPMDQLRNKGDRPYFFKTMLLKKGEVYVSPFDLSVDHGRVEVPYKPVIRFATPVFDSRMEKKGVIVLNYLGENLIESLRESGSVSSGTTLLLNAEGFWLCAADPGDEWGFMLVERKGCNFAKKFPEEWAKISRKDFIQFINQHGMFTSTTIFPALEVALKRGDGDPDGKSELSDRHWMLVSHIPYDVLHKSNLILLKELFWVGLVLLLGSLFPVWVIAKRMVRRQTSQEALYFSANYDEITGLLKRAPFVERLESTYEESRRYRRKFGLLFIDLDDFKSVNDNFGHAEGDRVLAETSRRLVAAIRKSDTVGRMGGDEFAVLLPAIEGQKDMEVVAEKILKKLSAPFPISNRLIELGASIGICYFPKHNEPPEILLKKADDAMYEAKRSGKNTYRLAD